MRTPSRDVIHAFNERGLAALDPRWAGGRPRLISDEDIAFIIQTARSRRAARAAAHPISGQARHHRRSLTADIAARLLSACGDNPDRLNHPLPEALRRPRALQGPDQPDNSRKRSSSSRLTRHRCSSHQPSSAGRREGPAGRAGRRRCGVPAVGSVLGLGAAVAGPGALSGSWPIHRKS
ncbi:helix-turn-helix domain-containing protein [Nonomuraea sp. B10E15]|uniref:helix-turn-helix domain-containing protein n=1 Tax=Nonomuraea sp. B10E15 TaxID=3153560 RepID=UPI00325F9E7E